MQRASLGLMSLTAPLTTLIQGFHKVIIHLLELPQVMGMTLLITASQLSHRQ